MEQYSRELKSWAKLIQKAIDGKAKARFHLFDMLQNMDQRVLRGWWLVKSTKLSYKDAKVKDLRAVKPKAKSQLLTLEQAKKAYDKAKKEK